MYVSVALLFPEISIKTHFMWDAEFCDFVRKNSSNCGMEFFAILSRWRPRKNVILLQFFMNWTTMKERSIPTSISRIVDYLKWVFTRSWQDVWSFEGQNQEGWPAWIKKSYQIIIKIVLQSPLVIVYLVIVEYLEIVDKTPAIDYLLSKFSCNSGFFVKSLKL